MKKINHPFFDHLETISKTNTWSAYAGERFPKARFFKALKVAHPFVFDKKTTDIGMSKEKNNKKTSRRSHEVQ